DGSSTLSFPGAVCVFTRSGTTWTSRVEIRPADRHTNDTIGADSVSLSGTTLFMSGSGVDATAAGQGAAYVYTGSGASWTQQDKIFADDQSTGDAFGFDVAVSGDRAVIGAHTWDGPV